jgi:LPXTG-motif cell wall-anchored protein
VNKTHTGTGSDSKSEKSNGSAPSQPSTRSADTGPSAQTNTDNTDDDVQGGVIQRPSTPDQNDDDVEGKVIRNAQPETAPAAAPQVLGNQVEAAPGGALPFTGANIASFLAAAAGLIGSGSVIMRRRRK